MQTGQLLLAGANILGPWFSRGADNAVFTWELIQATGDAALTVTIWHKNLDDIGPDTEITTAWSTTGSFRHLQVSGLKELVRFEYTVAGTPATGTVTVDEGPPTTVPLDGGVVAWIMYRMLEPTWFDTMTTGS